MSVYDFLLLLLKDNKAYIILCFSVGDLPTRKVKSAKNSNEVWR